MFTKLIVTALILIIEIKFGHFAFINDTCSSIDDCEKDVKYSDCLFRCICPFTPEFIDKDNVTRCSAPPSHKCRSDGFLNCVDHANCTSGNCLCNPGYMEDRFYMYYNYVPFNVCSKNITVKLNGSCEGDTQCKRADEYSYCDSENRCECKRKRKKISGIWRCTTMVTIGGKCNDVRLCPDKHSTCTNNTCTCNDGYKKIGSYSCVTDDKPDNNDDDAGGNVAMIIGISFGVLCILFIFLSVYMGFKKRRRNNFNRI